MSASLIGHLRSSTFRLSTTAVSMSLTGSRFSSESAPRPFHYVIRGRGGTIFGSALPLHQRQVQADIRTHLIHRPAKDRLGSISKQGDRYLRSLFVAGALAVIRYAKIHGTKRRPWLTALLARRPTKVAAIALANKIARMVWAMMVRGERYKQPVALAA